MKLKYSDYFKKRLQQRLTKNPILKTKINKQLNFLQKNLRHPSLKTHRLKGSRAEEYAIWIEGNLRITFIIADEVFLFTDFITHDEY